MNGKLDWIARIRPTAIVFGLLLTGMVALIVVDLRDGQSTIPAEAWAIIGFAVKGLADALKDLIAKNGGD